MRLWHSYKQRYHLFLAILILFWVLNTAGARGDIFSESSKSPGGSTPITDVDRARVHYFYRGEKEKALKILDQHLRNNPNDASAYYLQSRIYEDEEDFNKAIESLNTALTLDPENPKYLSSQGTLLFYKGRNEEALQIFTKLAQMETSDPKIHNMLAQIQIRLRQYKEGEKSINKAISLDSGNYEYYKTLAQCEIMLGKDKEAAQAYENAIKNGCNQNSVYFTLAGLYEDMGKYDKAIQVNKKILEKSPKEMTVYKNLSRIYRMKGDYWGSIDSWLLLIFKGVPIKKIFTTAIWVIVLFVFFIGAFRTVNSILLLPFIIIAGGLKSVPWLETLSNISAVYALDHLIYLCNYEIILIDPTHAAAWHNMGVYHEQKNHYDKAEKYYRQATQCKADFPEAWISLSAILHRQKKYKESEIAVKKALELGETFLAWYYLAVNFYQQEMYPEAADAAQKSMELFGEFAPPIDIFVQSCESTGDIARCENFLKELSLKYPENVKLVMELGNLFLSSGRAREALDYFEKATEISEERYEIWYNYGLAQRESGLISQSIASMKKAIEISPTSSWMYTSFGLTQIMNKKLDEARNILEKSLKIDPGSSYSHFLLGLIYKDLDFSKAKIHFEKSIENFNLEIARMTKPWQRANGYEYIAKAQKALGHSEMAKEALEYAVKYASLTPENVWIFSEDRLRLTKPSEFILECEKEIKSFESEDQIESTGENKKNGQQLA